MAVGKVIIGTRLDTKQLEKDLKNSEKELQKYEKEAEKLTKAKAKIDIDLQEYEKQKQLIQTSTDETLKLAQTEEQVNNVLALEKAELDELTQKYSTQIQKAEEINSKIESNAVSQSMLNDKIQETSQKLKQVKGFENIKDKIEDVNKGLTKTVKKVGKWALGIFGIRSAYNAVRSAMSTLSQYDDTMASNIQYITYALANTLKPVIETILNLVVRLLQYINYIVKEWTGKNLFKTADAFKNAQKNAKGLNKELQKTTASFDEINTVSSQSTGGTDTGGISTPSVDLTGIQGEIPGWVDWIAKNGKKVAVIIGLIGTAILGLKIAKFIKGFKDAKSVLSSFKSSIALVVAGIVLLVGNIINLILNWDKMTAKEKAISIALAAVGAAFIALGYAIATGISVATLGIGAIIAGIVALVTALVTLIAKWASEEKAIKDVTTAQKDLKTAQDEYADAQDSYIDAVDRATEAFDKLNEVQKETGLSGENLYNKVQDGTLDYANMTDQQKEVYKAYLDNIKAQDNLKTSTDELAEAKKKEKEASWGLKLATAAEKGEFDNYKKSVVDAFNKGELSAEEARDAIGKAMSEMSTSSQKTFMSDLPSDIKNGLDPKNYQTTGQKLKNWFGNLWESIKNGASSAWNKVKSWFGFSSGGVTYGSSTGFAKGGIIKMASGGIINQPGRGIPLTNAIGGEAGREGIIPLTDSQQMALIGEAIGKYVRIDNIIDVNMDSRRINRILQSSSNRTALASNR